MPFSPQVLCETTCKYRQTKYFAWKDAELIKGTVHEDLFNWRNVYELLPESEGGLVGANEVLCFWANYLVQYSNPSILQNESSSNFKYYFHTVLNKEIFLKDELLLTNSRKVSIRSISFSYLSV